MNTEQKIDYDTLHKAQVMLWAAHGWKIQIRYRYQTHWTNNPSQSWNWYNYDYRIDPAQFDLGSEWKRVDLGQEIKKGETIKAFAFPECYDTACYEAIDFIPININMTYFRRKQPTVKTVPLEFSDWLGKTWWIKNKTLGDTCVYLVAMISEDGISADCEFYQHCELTSNWQRSCDGGATWEPCSKEVAL